MVLIFFVASAYACGLLVGPRKKGLSIRRELSEYLNLNEDFYETRSLSPNTYLVKPGDQTKKKREMNPIVQLKHDPRNYLPDALFAFIYLLFAWRGLPIGSTVCLS